MPLTPSVAAMFDAEETKLAARLDSVRILREIAEEFPDLIESLSSYMARPRCPLCGGDNVVDLNGQSHRRGLQQCRDCRRQFSETSHTQLRGSRLSKNVRDRAMEIMRVYQRIPASQLRRELGLGSYKTAWKLKRDIEGVMRENVQMP